MQNHGASGGTSRMGQLPNHSATLVGSAGKAAESGVDRDTLRLQRGDKAAAELLELGRMTGVIIAAHQPRHLVKRRYILAVSRYL